MSLYRSRCHGRNASPWSLGVTIFSPTLGHRRRSVRLGSMIRPSRRSPLCLMANHSERCRALLLIALFALGASLSRSAVTCLTTGHTQVALGTDCCSSAPSCCDDGSDPLEASLGRAPSACDCCVVTPERVTTRSESRASDVPHLTIAAVPSASLAPAEPPAIRGFRSESPPPGIPPSLSQFLSQTLRL